MIEGEIELTARLWDGLAVKPLVLSPNVLSSRLNPRGADYVRRLQIIPFLHAMTEAADHPDDTVNHLRLIIRRTRRRLGLSKSDPLRLVLVGSHTSVANQERMGRIQAGENWHELSRQEFFAGLLRERTLAGRLHLALDGLEGITCHWLADMFPNLRPTRRAPRFADLVTEARRRLARKSVSSGGIRVMRPSVPLIYTRIDGSGWQPFKGGRARPYTTTNKLIGEFRKARAAKPSLEGVLIKVLPEDVTSHNPLDPPMITTIQLLRAQVAGLSAVLLDRRYGIVSLNGKQSPVVPIYAV